MTEDAVIIVILTRCRRVVGVCVTRGQLLRFAALISFGVCAPGMAFLWHRAGSGKHVQPQPSSSPVASPLSDRGIELQQLIMTTPAHHAFHDLPALDAAGDLDIVVDADDDAASGDDTGPDAVDDDDDSRSPDARTRILPTQSPDGNSEQQQQSSVDDAR